MPRDPNIPDAFDVYTIVVLRRPPDAPELSQEERGSLQARHLAYRAELRRQGKLVANGPFDAQSDPSYRVMSIFACDAAEAQRLSDGDPSVVAGWHAYDVMEWWVSDGSLAFPFADRPIGERRRTGDLPRAPREQPRRKGHESEQQCEQTLLVVYRHGIIMPESGPRSRHSCPTSLRGIARSGHRVGVAGWRS